MSTVYFKKTFDISSRTVALEAMLKHLPQYAKDSFVAVKLTVGDKDSRYHLNPDMVAQVIKEIKKMGCKPFVFDTNVIYKGRRNNAVDHLNLAYEKGFTPERIGAPFIIADGLLGLDGKEIGVDLKHLKKIKIPSFYGAIENLVVLSHITGHIMCGYAGALKNVSMGMSCRSGKQIQHSSIKPKVISKKCVMCGACLEICPAKAISEKDSKAFIDSNICLGCGECMCVCVSEAITVNWKTDLNLFAERMVEYSAGILSKFKNKFFINFAFDITKECDCISNAQDPIISSDLGILASNQILGVDKATIDLLNKKEDVFAKAQKDNAYRYQLSYAQELIREKKWADILGSMEYELVEV